MCILKKQAVAAPLPWATHETSSFSRLIEADQPVAQSVKSTGSARRKLWQLSPNATCPVVGVCLRLPELVRLAKKVDIDTTDLSEYDLHITVVSECKNRTRLAEEVQRELESRFSLVVGNVRRIRTTEDLDAWCHQELAGAHLSGALWAALTHAKCTPELEYKLLGHVHMLQHHVGMVVRADHSQLEVLALRNSRLNAELQGARDRIAAQAAELSSRQQKWLIEERQLRGEAARLNSVLSRALSDAESFVRATPDLGERLQLSESNKQLQSQVRALQKELARYRDELAQERNNRKQEGTSRTEDQDAWREPRTQNTLLGSPADGVALQDCTVLCVGGRTANIPIYREVVEHKGARFLHHDGGEEDSISKLSSDLTTADLVLCQVGCIGHNAYWRVKEHCKRHNKPCVFLKTPSRTALERALNVLDGDAVPDTHCPDEGV